MSEQNETEMVKIEVDMPPEDSEAFHEALESGEPMVVLVEHHAKPETIAFGEINSAYFEWVDKTIESDVQP